MTFKVAELFAGIGGFRLALSKVYDSAEVVFVSEISPSARSVYESNFGEVPRGDITKISVDEIPDHHLLLVGFPYYRKTIAGLPKKESDDVTKKSKLIKTLARILHAKKPNAFVFQTSSDIRDIQGGRVFSFIKKVFRKAGYFIHCEVLDALSFGLPQREDWLFIVGFSKNLMFKFPKGEQSDVKLKDVLLDDVSDKYAVDDDFWEKIKKSHRKYNINDPDGTALGLTKDYKKYTGKNVLSIDDNGDRMFTPREWARLMGFPDDFKLHRTDEYAYNQLKVATPIPIAEEVLRKVLTSLKHKKERIQVTDFIE